MCSCVLCVWVNAKGRPLLTQFLLRDFAYSDLEIYTTFWIYDNCRFNAMWNTQSVVIHVLCRWLAESDVPVTVSHVLGLIVLVV